MLGLSRGYRNNNPGNLRSGFDAQGKKILLYEGEINGPDKEFRTFKSMVYGYRAMFALINHYWNKGIRSISQIINTYAPTNENDTNAYINTVCKMTGMSPDYIIDQSDDIFMKQFIAAMSYKENGIKANMNDVSTAYNLFYKY